jgi:hypothetical protein
MNDTKRTKQELDDLKAQWLADPCWDIYDTDGFQFHRDELYTYQERIEAEAHEKEEKRKEVVAGALGINRIMLVYIEGLEARIAKLEAGQ